MNNFTGKGLSVGICCCPLPCYDWMSFVCWRSLFNFFPDAEFFLVSNRGDYNLFSWARTLRMKIIWQEKEKLFNSKSLLVDANILMLREYELNSSMKSFCGGIYYFDGINEVKEVDGLYADIVSEEIKPFCGYGDGWGKFVMAEWIHSKACPFKWALKFRKDFMTCNEAKVLNLWHQAEKSFAILSRGSK